MNNTNKNLVDAKEHINNAASELSSTCISFKDHIRYIANECNCRAEHGAEGKEHLLQIEKMLRQALAINEIKPQ